ncbi:MAG: spondin domain-containing protein, partial [Actinomycetota bacterium]
MRSMRVTAVALVAAVVASVFVGSAAEATDGSSGGEGLSPVYEITITNTTEGQYLTPPNWAAHSRRVDVFQRGRPASPGVEAVAERGGVEVLRAELEGAVDNTGNGVSGVAGDAPIPPGESATVTVTSNERRLSIVSMIICTNDGFGGVDSVRLPTRDGQTRTYNLRDFDAGTELNTELRADIVPAPFCSTPEGAPGGTGEDQPEIDGFGRINRHPTLTGVGDLPDRFDWDRGSVGTVTVTRVAQPSAYSVTVENLTEGQYFTPVNFAAHSQAADVFSLGKPASPGVEAVAERGGVEILEAELAAAIDDKGLGVSGVGDGPAGPIGPGQTRSFEFTTDQNRLSIVSMIICTNDGFAGLDSRRLPGAGSTRTYYLRAFDAGTELNTELRADIVPAPFCSTPEGAPGGTGEDQPEIDGFGR